MKYSILTPTLILSLFITNQLQSQTNVGIGTTTPAHKLDVMGRARIQAGTVNNVLTSAGIWFTDYRNNSDMVFVGMVDSVNYGFWSQKAGIGWQAYWDARYGNMGLGIKPNSSARLSISSEGGSNLTLYNGTSYKGVIGTTDTTMFINGTRSINVLSSGNDLIIQQPGGCTTSGQFIFCSYPGNIGMYVNKPNARVHIGAGTHTSGLLIGSSSSLPATGYMLNVDGKIICEELKVQTSGSWPDYVFADDYEMPTITELEQKVMNQKHLPGIPSAAQVSADKGIVVGEMQKQLLEKVEELYRYVFQVNNENIALKKRVETLEKETKK